MDILYAGAFGPNSAELPLRDGFVGEGHTVHCLDYRADRFRLRGAMAGVPPCHAFFLQRGDHFPLPVVRGLGVPAVFWDTEVPAQFYPEEGNNAKNHDRDHLLRSGAFDFIYFYTEEIRQHYVGLGWVDGDRCGLLSGAFNPEVHRRLPNVEKNIDVVFVGSSTERRRRFFAELGRYAEVTVVSAYGEEMVRLYNRAKIVLNVHCSNCAITETRVYEALACGAFLLTERLAPDSPFGDDALVEVDSVAAMADRIHHYLAAEDERMAIADRGYEQVRHAHTYRHRAATIASKLSDLRHADAPVPLLRETPALTAYWALESAHYGLRKARQSLGRLKRAVAGRLSS